MPQRNTRLVIVPLALLWSCVINFSECSSMNDGSLVISMSHPPISFIKSSNSDKSVITIELFVALAIINPVSPVPAPSYTTLGVVPWLWFYSPSSALTCTSRMKPNPRKKHLCPIVFLFDDQLSSIAVVSIIDTIGGVAKVHDLDIDMFQVIVISLMG